MQGAVNPPALSSTGVSVHFVGYSFFTQRDCTGRKAASIAELYLDQLDGRASSCSETRTA